MVVVVVCFRGFFFFFFFFFFWGGGVCLFSLLCLTCFSTERQEERTIYYGYLLSLDEVQFYEQ